MTRSIGLSALAAAVLVSCAGFEPQDGELAGPWVLHDAESELAEPEHCGMAFDPAPELLEAVTAAAARWSAATECDVRVEAGGLPVVAWSRVYAMPPDGSHEFEWLNDVDPQLRGREVCGATIRKLSGKLSAIYLPTNAPELCPELSVIAAHELGHALGPVLRHSESGLMHPSFDEQRNPPLNEESLSLICETLECASFQPEG